jgi:hypothetical protein
MNPLVGCTLGGNGHDPRLGQNFGDNSKFGTQTLGIDLDLADGCQMGDSQQAGLSLNFCTPIVLMHRDL